MHTCTNSVILVFEDIIGKARNGRLNARVGTQVDLGEWNGTTEDDDDMTSLDVGKVPASSPNSAGTNIA